MFLKTLSTLKGEFRVSSPVFRHAVRAAVAITVAIAAANHLTLSNAVWIPISVIVIMRPSLGGTLQISWKRFSGTVIGALAGVLLICMNLSFIAVFFWYHFFPFSCFTLNPIILSPLQRPLRCLWY